MPRKPRIHYTETDKALMWDRWRKGDSLEKIAQLFDLSNAFYDAGKKHNVRTSSTIHKIFSRVSVMGCIFLMAP